MAKRLRGREYPPTLSVFSEDSFDDQAIEMLKWQQCVCCCRWYEKTDSVPATIISQGQKRKGVICRYCCGSGQKFVELKKMADKNRN